MAEGGQEKILAETQNYQVKAKKKKIGFNYEGMWKEQYLGIRKFYL